MKCYFNFIWLISISLLTLGINQKADSAPIHIKLCENAIPPYIIATPDGKMDEKSILVREMHEIFDAIPEINFSLHLIPWDICLKMIQRGHMDGALMLAKTPEREKIYVYSDISMLYPESLFYNKERFPDGLYITSFAELKNYRMGVQKGHVYDPAIELMRKNNEITEQSVEDTKQNILKLLKNRVDLFIDSTITTRYSLYKMGLLNKVGVTDINNIPIIYNEYMGFNKNSKVIKYLPLINKRLKELHESGRIKEILYSQEYYQ